MTTLEEKFHNFILSRSSNESVDDLPNSLFQKKKADYLIKNIHICLKSDILYVLKTLCYLYNKRTLEFLRGFS